MTFDASVFEEYINDVEIIDMNISGWKPLSIRFLKKTVYYTCYLVWQVIGTNKVWWIDMQTVYIHHKENIKDHFILTLSTFKDDILEWVFLSEPNRERWMNNYIEQFGNLILL